MQATRRASQKQTTTRGRPGWNCTKASIALTETHIGVGQLPLKTQRKKKYVEIEFSNLMVIRDLHAKSCKQPDEVWYSTVGAIGIAVLLRHLYCRPSVWAWIAKLSVKLLIVQLRCSAMQSISTSFALSLAFAPCLPAHLGRAFRQPSRSAPTSV